MKRRIAAELHPILTSHFPLKKAVLCLDCSSISDANQECPACCSGALMNLSRVLNPAEQLPPPAVTQSVIAVAA
jgi:hypothetical protein